MVNFVQFLVYRLTHGDLSPQFYFIDKIDIIFSHGVLGSCTQRFQVDLSRPYWDEIGYFSKLVFMNMRPR